MGFTIGDCHREDASQARRTQRFYTNFANGREGGFISCLNHVAEHPGVIVRSIAKDLHVKPQVAVRRVLVVLVAKKI